MIGKKILNYEVKSLIGKGGMGDVYLGEHLSIGREVAIKVLKPELASNQEIRSRFKNEASVMARLQHPGIVALYDYVEQDDGLYLIMEYVQGQELTDLLKQLDQPLSIDRAKKIMIQVLAAFAYAHKNGVVHRDVKPSNIIIDKEDNVKVLDFGIAKLVGESQFNLTKTGTQVGTVYYMSPEQVKAQELDHRSDIYSLGITFYEVLSGFCPYTSLTSEYEVYDKIVREPLLSLKETMGASYDTLWAVIEKATAKKPEDRFQSCADFTKALNSSAVYSDDNEVPLIDKPKNNRYKILLFLLIGLFVLVSLGVFISKNRIRDKEVTPDISEVQNSDRIDEQITKDVERDLSDLNSSDMYYSLNASSTIYSGEKFELELRSTSQLEDHFKFTVMCPSCENFYEENPSDYVGLINRSGNFDVQVYIKNLNTNRSIRAGVETFNCENKIVNSGPDVTIRLWLNSISTVQGYNLQNRLSYSDYMAGYGTTYDVDIYSINVLSNDGSNAKVEVYYRSYDSVHPHLEIRQVFSLTNYRSVGWIWNSIKNISVDEI